MKTLLIISLSLFSITTFAKGNKEWKAAKETCKMKDNTMKGKMLKKCIKEEMAKAKEVAAPEAKKE